MYSIDDSIFGVFADASPDRWGQILLNKRERNLADREKRKPRRLNRSDFLMGVYKIGMSEMQIKNYVEKLSENGVKPETFAKFLDENEKCTEIENEKIYKAIEEAEKIENPNISDFEVQEKIDEMGEKFKKKLE